MSLGRDMYLGDIDLTSDDWWGKWNIDVLLRDEMEHDHGERLVSGPQVRRAVVRVYLRLHEDRWHRTVY